MDGSDASPRRGVGTLSGTPRSWTPDLSVEGVLSSVLLNFVDCESVVVRTASGPGGRSGPLRVDLDGRFHPDVMREYSEHEALAAFERMREHHSDLAPRHIPGCRGTRVRLLVDVHAALRVCHGAALELRARRRVELQQRQL